MHDFIQVIVPLRLGWEPWYRAEKGSVSPGDWVKVRVGGREYDAVVSVVSREPGIDPSRIRPVSNVPDTLPSVLDTEILFWRMLSEYYLCETGEVLKYVYPRTRLLTEVRTSRSARAPSTAVSVQPLPFAEGKPLLLAGGSREGVYRKDIDRTLTEGRTVLVIRPDAAKDSFAAIRDNASAARNGEAVVIEGNRFYLFLPFTNLGLVIVDEEQSEAYKQNNAAPRYNVRDAAVMLASLHRSRVILGSSCPSLESLYNCMCGKFLRMDAGDGLCPLPSGDDLIDSSSERLKNGMRGSFSVRLLGRISQVFSEGGRVLLMLPWKNTDDVEIEARKYYPRARTRLKVLPFAEYGRKEFSKYKLVVLLRADYLFGREDFRSDEKGLARCRIAAHRAFSAKAVFIIQGEDIGLHLSVTGEQLLGERRALGYPPFTRMVEVVLNDDNEKRRTLMSSRLACRLPGFPLFFFRKDKDLLARKTALLYAIRQFEDENKYYGHIVVNVDP